MHRLRPHSVEALALDFEGTLISNAISRFPRPGLSEFLELCRTRFPILLIYSGVREKRFRKVAAQLIIDGVAPRWFGDLRHEHWVSEYKDLRRLEGASLETTALVDDQEDCVHPEQLGHWVEIKAFERPYSSEDTELMRVAEILDGLAVARGGDAV